MINQAFTLQARIEQLRANQKEWQRRCKEKGIDMTWKAHINKRRPITFVPINASMKNSKQAWLEDFI